MATPVVATIYGDLFVGVLSAAPAIPLTAPTDSPVQPVAVVSPVVNISYLCRLTSQMGIGPTGKGAAAAEKPQGTLAVTFPTIYKERPKGSLQVHPRNFPVLATDQRISYT